MNFPSIDIQGSILSSDLFGKIRSEQAGFQQGKDFSPALTTTKLKDEISLAWQDAKGQWTIFQNKLKRLGAGETAATETRSFWILPLLSNLGYDFQYLKSAEELNGKSFWINNRDNNIGGFPLFIAGCNESLDRRSENKTLRVSPHALVQEYLNYSEHLYGLVTNGKLLRLLRDASRLTRLSYLEFNLEKIMEEDLYSDFVIFYRLLHVSRMRQQQVGGAESIIDKYHLEGLEAGATIRSKLGDAVKESILALAKGFVNHPDNAKLRQAIANGQFETDEFYRQQLRTVYRLLFLFVIEERNLVYSESKDPDIRRFSQIYYRYFSLQRLRKLAKNLPPPDSARHYDLWMSLVNSFALFEEQQIGAKMGIMALQGDLFSYDAITSSGYDLHQCRLGNDVLLRVIKALGYFENDQKMLIAVNYGGLDVEEFGSVYEGLLELKLNIQSVEGTSSFSCSYAGSEERSKSGSHYTPDELVQPLIKHSLDYLLADRKKIIMDIITRQRFFGPDFRTKRQELVMQIIYSLKVCDIACGSGHLLISGARRIAEVAACIIEEEEQPNPKAFQLAKRNAILNCIYGVDKNPLAVELCKVALWLEAYVPGQPLNFLDHHIKCGDSIVGLAHREELENGIPDEAFKTLPGDEKEVAQTFAKRNRNERKEREDKQKAQQLKTSFETNITGEVNEAMVEYKTFNRLPETTPEEIERKAKAYHRFMGGKGYGFLKAMADAQVAQFFIPKTTANKDALLTDADFRMMLSGFQGWQGRKTGKATSVGSSHRFFHWFLEFPEVMNEGGFDCILGNPPFLGGLKISLNYSYNFLTWLHYDYPSAKGTCDLVAYFFRRSFSIISKNGFASLISTNTISQGDTRTGSLEVITKEGVINHAVKSMKWPGLAAVEVALVTITKRKWLNLLTLNNKTVNSISSYLDESEPSNVPYELTTNRSLSYIGSFILGDGFILSATEAKNLIKQNIENAKAIFPVLNGDEINSSFKIIKERYAINFFDFSYEYVKSNFPLLLKIIEENVKPDREKITWSKSAREKWWLYERPRVELYKVAIKLDSVFVTALTGKYLCFTKVKPEFTFTHAVGVIVDTSFASFNLLQSSFHEIWAWKFCSSMGISLRYAPSDGFQNFPFPLNLKSEKKRKSEQLGEEYYLHRSSLMVKTQLGLTKTYNAFHAKEINANLPASADLSVLDKKAIEKQFGKEVWNLWNHLQKTPSTCTFEEAVAGIIKLRELHMEMDQAVLEAYGWGPDPSTHSTGSQGPVRLIRSEAETLRQVSGTGWVGSMGGAPIQLRHNFYEVDYLPENDRVRYTIHPEARKEILKRLLELNHQIHEEEVRQGLWDKKKTGKEYKSKASDKGNIAQEPEEGFGQGKLF